MRLRDLYEFNENLEAKSFNHHRNICLRIKPSNMCSFCSQMIGYINFAPLGGLDGSGCVELTSS